MRIPWINRLRLPLRGNLDDFVTIPTEFCLLDPEFGDENPESVLHKGVIRWSRSFLEEIALGDLGPD